MAAERQTVAFRIYGPIARADLPGLCDRVCALLRANRSEVVLCDVTGVEPDAVTVDALARLQLAAKRLGCQVRLCNASPDLLDLVAFMGLRDVLPYLQAGSRSRETPRSARADPGRANSS